MQSDVPKQYLELHGRSVLEHTLSCFLQHPAITGFIVVLHAQDPYWPNLHIASELPIYTVEGGRERADSVYNGLHFLIHELQQPDATVLVHDAARPCLSASDLDALLAQRDNPDGAILATPVRDTMKRARAGCIDHTVDREGLWHALTPQMFAVKNLYQALSRALQEAAVITDEASAMEYVDKQPMLVEGLASNIKITRPEDLSLAAFFLQGNQGNRKYTQQSAGKQDSQGK